MIRIRFFGSREFIQRNFSAAQYCVFNTCFKFQRFQKQAQRRSGPGAKGQKQTTNLEDVVVMMAWEIWTIEQKVGALRCGANFVVILSGKIWKQQLAEVCEVWCAKQQEKDDGTAHPWACSKRGAAFRCVISLLNRAATADSPSAPRNTELHPGWSKVGFAEMAKCKPAVWDSVLGSLEPIHPQTQR